MKKIMPLFILSIAIAGLLPFTEVFAAAYPIYDKRPTMVSRSATYNATNKSVTVSASGKLGWEQLDPECQYDPNGVATHAATVSTTGTLSITDGPSGVSGSIPITITPGSNGTCDSLPTAASYSGSKTFSGLNLAPGFYTVTLRITDRMGSIYQDVTFQVPATGTPPSVTCSGSVSGNTITWTTSVTNGPVSYSWSGTDGLSGSGSSVAKTYSTTGTKSATIDVSSSGGSDSDSCTATIPIPPPPGDPDPNLVGYHDSYSGNVSATTCKAQGWVKDPDTDPTNIQIRVKSDGVTVASGIYAGTYRSDLTGVCSGGSCSFSVDLANLISRGVNHSILVEGYDTNANEWQSLGTSPKTLNCAADIQPPTANLSSTPANSSSSPIPYNTAATLSWTSTNATSCISDEFDTGYGDPVQGSVSTGNLTATKTYGIACGGQGGVGRDTETVYVGAPAIVSVSSNLPTTWTLNAPNAQSRQVQSTNSSGAVYRYQTPGTYSVTAPDKAGYVKRISPTSSTVSAGGSISFEINYYQNPTVTISASSTTVAYNTASTLTWSSTNATSCTASASPSVSTWSGSKSTSGTVSTGNLTAARTYTITCDGQGGSASASVRVGVTPFVDLNVNAPKNITSGQSATLSWSSLNATSCTASANPAKSNWTGPKTPNVSGSQSTGPLTATTAYTLTCNNADGSASDTDSVTVGPVPPPTLSLTASPTSTSTSLIPYNTAVTLNWSSTNTSSCTASASPANSNWTGSKALSGTQSSGNLVTTTTFTLNCQGLNGTPVSGSVTAYVAGATGTVIVNSNRPTTWNLTGAAVRNQTTAISTATYTGMPTGIYTLVPAPLGGYTHTVSPSDLQTASQSLTAGGTITFNITYTAVIPPTVDLTADSYNVPYNSGTTLHWISTNATTCTVSNGWAGTRPVSGNEPTGNLTTARTYTITCDGQGGLSASDTVTINVSAQPPLYCTPASQTVFTGQVANFSSSGGTGTYSWSAVGGSPSTGGNASTFSTSWATTGTKTVTVNRGTLSANCSVTVNAIPQDFTLARSVNITAETTGTSTQSVITVLPTGGFASPVALSFFSSSPALSGATYSFTPTSLSSGGYATGSRFQVTLPTPVPPGNYTITIRGTSASPAITRSVNVVLTVGDEGGIIPPYIEF